VATASGSGIVGACWRRSLIDTMGWRPTFRILGIGLFAMEHGAHVAPAESAGGLTCPPLDARSLGARGAASEQRVTSRRVEKCSGPTFVRALGCLLPGAPRPVSWSSASSCVCTRVRARRRARRPLRSRLEPLEMRDGAYCPAGYPTTLGDSPRCASCADFSAIALSHLGSHSARAAVLFLCLRDSSSTGATARSSRCLRRRRLISTHAEPGHELLVAVHRLGMWPVFSAHDRRHGVHVPSATTVRLLHGGRARGLFLRVLTLARPSLPHAVAQVAPA
jgi:hypothetical protein